MNKKIKYGSVAGCIAALCLLFAGCGQTGESEELVFEWPLGTSSPEDTVTQLTHYIMLFMNQGLFDGLEEEQQEILTAAGRAASEYAREQADERVEDRLAHIEKSGTEIITLSDELYSEMQEASADIYEEIRGQVGNELVDLYMGEK